MRSTSGAHFIALDHVRAVAAFMVFTWHFAHGEAPDGYPVLFNYVPVIFPLSVLDEGHTGVALFMTLSGYLFAKLLNGRSINYPAFLWNRGLRLLPLLAVVIVAVGIQTISKGQSAFSYIYTIAKGFVFPTLPNGGWSITVECHYYLILPLFLWMFKKSKFFLFSLVFAAIVLRFFLFHERGEVQSLSYRTIIGRIDQFALGMIMFQFRTFATKRHYAAIFIVAGFTLLYWHFDRQGGYFHNPSYPSTNPIWIILPTIEGIAYATLIAWYETSFNHSPNGLSKLLGKLGEYSYSIYLLHFFVVFHAAKFVNEHIMIISNFYLACLWSLLLFLLMTPIGYLSFRFIEAPFLAYRKRYIIAT